MNLIYVKVPLLEQHEEWNEQTSHKEDIFISTLKLKVQVREDKPHTKERRIHMENVVSDPTNPQQVKVRENTR